MTTETSNARGLVGMPTWRKQKPTRSGVYGVRGFNLGDEPEDQFEAIVAVRLYDDELVCNLHESTSEDDFDNWMLVADISDKFEWCEFAAAPPPAAARGDVRGLVAKVRKFADALTQSSSRKAGQPWIEAQARQDVGHRLNALLDTLAAEGVQAGECCVPDAGEPSFVLLGRDPQAPALIEAWAADRERAEPDSDKPAKARAIAVAMREYKAANPGKGLPASALSQQPEARGVVDGEVTFNAAFFVSRSGNRIEQMTTYDDYRRDGALLALMDLGQKRASARGLTKKNAGKVTLAWVTAPQIVECDAALTGERNA